MNPTSCLTALSRNNTGSSPVCSGFNPRPWGPKTRENVWPDTLNRVGIPGSCTLSDLRSYEEAGERQLLIDHRAFTPGNRFLWGIGGGLRAEPFGLIIFYNGISGINGVFISVHVPANTYLEYTSSGNQHSHHILFWTLCSPNLLHLCRTF